VTAGERAGLRRPVHPGADAQLRCQYTPLRYPYGKAAILTRLNEPGPEIPVQSFGNGILIRQRYPDLVRWMCMLTDQSTPPICVCTERADARADTCNVAADEGDMTMHALNNPSTANDPQPRTMRGVDRQALRAELSKRYEHTLRRLGK